MRMKSPTSVPAKTETEPETTVPGRQRLFLALWPDESVRSRLTALIPKVLRAGDGRAVRPENLHATLFFLGPIEGRTRECVERMASALEGRIFSLMLDRVEHRPKQGIVWAAAVVPEALAALVDGLRHALLECGVHPETREYRAHVTLARKVRRAAHVGAIEPIAWHIDGFVLVESKTYPSGARYQVLRSWPLAP
jgi:2'-5' RNA ligase